MKRFLSVILSLLLILSCASFSFAEEAAAPLSAEEISAMIENGTLDLNLVTLRDFYTKTTAVSIGDRSISPALLNYSYITQYYSFLTQYGAYAANFAAFAAYLLNTVVQTSVNDVYVFNDPLPGVRIVSIHASIYHVMDTKDNGRAKALFSALYKNKGVYLAQVPVFSSPPS